MKSISRLYVVDPSEDDGQRTIGYFASEALAKEIGTAFFSDGSLSYETVDVVESKEDYVNLHKKSIVREIVSRLSGDEFGILKEFLKPIILEEMSETTASGSQKADPPSD